MPLFGNSLLARVLGHRSVATLYRSSAGDNNFAPVPAALTAPRAAPAAPMARSTGPVVMAKLVSPSATLPFGLAIQAEGVGRATPPGVTPAASVIQPLDLSPESGVPQPGPSLSQSLPVQREPDAPGPASTVPAAQVAAPAPGIIQQQSAAQPSSPVQTSSLASGQQSPVAQPTQTVQPPTAARPDQPKPAQAVPPPADLPTTTMGDSDFSWIADSEWNSLKSFMEGHQALQLQRQEAEGTLQRDPEEQARVAAKEQAAADLLQRQELARKGQLPRASVSYISPESAGQPPAVADLQARAAPGPSTQPPPAPPAPAPVQPDAAQAPVQRTEQAQSTAESPPAIQSPPAEKPMSAAERGEQRPPVEALGSPLAEVQAAPSPEIAPSPEVKPSPEIDRPTLVQRSVSGTADQEARLTPETAPGAELSSSPATQRTEQAVAPMSATPVPTIPAIAAPELPVAVPGPEATSPSAQTQSPVTTPVIPASVQAHLDTPSARPEPQPVADKSPLISPVQRSQTEEATSQNVAPVQLEPRAETVSLAQAESPAAAIESGEPALETKSAEPRGFRRIFDAARSLLRREDPALPEPVRGESDPQPRSEPVLPAALTTPALQREIAGPLLAPPPQAAQEAGAAPAEAALPRPEEAGSIQRSAAEPATLSPALAPTPDLNYPGPETTAPLPAVDQPLGPQSIFAAPDFGPVEAIRPTPVPAAPSTPQISRQEESLVSVQQKVAPPSTSPAAETIPEIAAQQLQSPEPFVSEEAPIVTPSVGESAPELATQRVQPSGPVVSLDVTPTAPAVALTPAEPAATPLQESLPGGQAEPVQPSSVDPGDAETLIQPFPLQAVFPVQELKAPKASTTPAIAKPPAGPAVQRKPTGIDQAGEVVHSTIKDVAPVKSTDSSIELITPRRPRPVLARKSEPGQPEIEAPASPTQDQIPSAEPAPSSTSPLQKQAEPVPLMPGDPVIAPSSQPAPVQLQPAAGPPTKVPPQSTSLAPAESAAATPPAGPVTAPYLVPTEIGDLPSDLWQMLGETPPQPKPAVQRTADTPPGRPAQTDPPPKLVTVEFHAPDIQQVGDLGGSSRESAGSGQGDQEDSGNEEGEGEIDVAEIARQVYPEIRRRLQVDWERGRGRLS